MSQESHAHIPNVGALNDGLAGKNQSAKTQTEAEHGEMRHERGTVETSGHETIITDPPLEDGLSVCESEFAYNRTPPVPSPLSHDASSVDETQAGSDVVGQILGDYKLLRKLGQGGMGEVYEAYQISCDRIVALKLLARKFSNNVRFIQRLQREARTMAKVDHPNILRCFDVGRANGYSFLTMEFIGGGNVETWLKKLGRFTLGDALHIILKVAEALQHAHDRNIIHRDIKPDNILLTTDGVIKLADLGLAKDTQEDFSLTKTGTSAGTPIYMAPEQARDAKHVDGRVDIYALGVMLYVFLTGLPPFKGKTYVELIAAKDKGTFDPMRAHRHEIPPKLDLIVDRMLAMDARRRFATCSEVIVLLKALGLANETLSFLNANPAETPVHPVCSTEMIEAETDVWYLKLMKGQGKVVTMQATTEQVRLLIKTRNLDGETQVSKSETAGFHPAASFRELNAYFQAKAAENPTPVQAPKPSNELNEPATEVWYLNVQKGHGKFVTMRATIEQMRLLIQTRKLDGETQVSKTESSGFQAAASFRELEPLFKRKETPAPVKERQAESHDVKWAGSEPKKAGFGMWALLVLLAVLAAAGGYFFYVTLFANS